MLLHTSLAPAGQELSCPATRSASSRAATAPRALPTTDCHTDVVEIEPVIAVLRTRYDPDTAALIERMLRELNGTIPDKQMIEEIGLALAIHRRKLRSQ